jgi:hypothetical protein
MPEMINKGWLKSGAHLVIVACPAISNLRADVVTSATHPGELTGAGINILGREGQEAAHATA